MKRPEYLAWEALTKEQIKNNKSQVKAMRREIEAIEYLIGAQENVPKECKE